MDEARSKGGAQREAAEPLVYLFVGDSLTEGQHGASYVERVARVVASSAAGPAGHVVNGGTAGDTVRSLLARIDGPLLSHRPDWVILAVGTNDAWFSWQRRRSLGWSLWLLHRGWRTGQLPTADLDRFAALYRALINRVQRAGARLVVCTVPPLGEDLSSPLNRRVASLNGVIRQAAADLHLPVADVWQAFAEELAVRPHPGRYLPSAWWSTASDARRLRRLSPDELGRRRDLALTFDGIHLNSRGADLWAAVVLRALSRGQREGDHGRGARRAEEDGAAFLGWQVAVLE